MITLNGALSEVAEIGHRPAENNDQELFGIQESLTKLWTALIMHKDSQEIGKRFANLLIGTMINAHRLGIDDIEYHFRKRMDEYAKELRA